MSAATVGDGRVDILGVPVNAINLDDAVAAIERWIRTGDRNYVCITDAHAVMESRRDRQLRRIYENAGLVTPDGMPLVWLARLLGKKRTTRVYGPDLMRTVTALSRLRGYRQFYYGGADGVAERLRQVLTAAYPDLQCVGVICPPFRPLSKDEDRSIVEAINKARPDILWVGLGAPKQEHWMAAHIGIVEAPVMIGVGAAFDFLSGVKRQAPGWMQRAGLEWFFRLCSEPKRLWRRYAYTVPGFAILATRDLLARALLP